MKALAIVVAGAVSSVSVTATSPPPLALGGVVIGATIFDSVHALGPPDLVVTADQGHTWQWAEAGGLDREVLTDDALVVREVLVAEPAALTNSSPLPVVQPSEVPVLGMSARAADTSIKALGGKPIAEPDASVRAWRLGGGVLVAELEKGSVQRLLAVDERSAQLLGYLEPALAAPAYRAPVLEKEFIPERLPEGTGTVVVRVDVDANGKVKDAKVIVPSGNGAIDDSELFAIKRSKFRPAVCAGVPCPGVYIDIGGMF